MRGGEGQERSPPWYRIPDQNVAIEVLSKRMSKSPNGDVTMRLQQLIRLFAARRGVLRRLRKDVRVQALLQIWLFIHVPMTIALLFALALHIFLFSISGEFMRILIRKLIQAPRGGVEYQDLEVQAEALTVGRAADQLLYLPGEKVAQRHAVFEKARREHNGECQWRRNDQRQWQEENTTQLKIGDVVTLGGHQLKVVRAPAGFTFGLEVVESANEEKQGVAGQK